MKKDTFEGLCSIVNEMTAVRQKVQDELGRRMKNYELPPEDITHIHLQMRNNLERINYYSKIKRDLRVVYDRYKDDIEGAGV